MLLMLLACAGGSVSLDDTAVDTGTLTVDDDQDGHAADVDCDDSDASIHPGADELCDGIDNDCDEVVDNDPVDAGVYFDDLDADGFGSGEGVSACELPQGMVDNDLDCDDGDPSIHPDAQEVCDPNDVDEDCDGDVDDLDLDVDADTFSEYWRDGDGDGYGDPAKVKESCDPLSGYVDNFDDCDDKDPEVWDECETGGGWDGAYSGTMELKVTASDLGISDTCSGTAEIDVVEGDSPAIEGTMSCSFSGVLASLIGSQEATIDGEVYGDDSADGEIDVGPGLVTDTWSGGFTKSKGGTLEGSVNGTTTYEGYKISYTGSFVVTR